MFLLQYANRGFILAQAHGTSPGSGDHRQDLPDNSRNRMDEPDRDNGGVGCGCRALQRLSSSALAMSRARDIATDTPSCILWYLVTAFTKSGRVQPAGDPSASFGGFALLASGSSEWISPPSAGESAGGTAPPRRDGQGRET